QRALRHLLRERVPVVTRARPEHGAAAPPDRVADVAHARAAGALLLPQLLAAAAHHPAALGSLRAATRLGLRLAHGLPDDARPHPPAEHLVAQGDRAHLLALRIDDVESHLRDPLPLALGLDHLGHALRLGLLRLAHQHVAVAG